MLKSPMAQEVKVLAATVTHELSSDLLTQVCHGTLAATHIHKYMHTEQQNKRKSQKPWEKTEVLHQGNETD